MKVLYIGSTPDNEADLALDREITALQRELLATSYEPVSFTFMPALAIEEFPNCLATTAPDIVHLSVHGVPDELYLCDSRGQKIKISAEILAGFLDSTRSARVVYLNACNSVPIAKSLAESFGIPHAIGSTAPISNQAARSSAVQFYRMLLQGRSVAQAYNNSSVLVKALSAATGTEIKLFSSKGILAEQEIIHNVPELLARFHGKAQADADGNYQFRFGLAGCAPSTTQIVFFTDDESFISDEDEENENIQNSIAYVVRSPRPSPKELWTSDGSIWEASKNHRLLATAVAAVGGAYTLDSTLCVALETYYKRQGHELKPAIRTALRNLRG